MTTLLLLYYELTTDVNGIVQTKGRHVLVRIAYDSPPLRDRKKNRKGIPIPSRDTVATITIYILEGYTMSVAENHEETNAAINNVLVKTSARNLGRQRPQVELFDPEMQYAYLNLDGQGRIQVRLESEALLRDLDKTRYDVAGRITILARRRRRTMVTDFAEAPTLWESCFTRQHLGIDTCQMVFNADGSRISTNNIHRFNYARDDNGGNNQVEIFVSPGMFLALGGMFPKTTVMAVYQVASISDVQEIPAGVLRSAKDVAASDLFAINLDLVFLSRWNSSDPGNTIDSQFRGFEHLSELAFGLTEVIWYKMQNSLRWPIGVDRWSVVSRKTAEALLTEYPTDTEDTGRDKIDATPEDFVEHLKSILTSHRRMLQGVTTLRPWEQSRPTFVRFAYRKEQVEDIIPGTDTTDETRVTINVVHITAEILSPYAGYTSPIVETTLEDDVWPDWVSECPLAVFNSRDFKHLLNKVPVDGMTRTVSAFY